MFSTKTIVSAFAAAVVFGNIALGATQTITYIASTFPGNGYTGIVDPTAPLNGQAWSDDNSADQPFMWLSFGNDLFQGSPVTFGDITKISYYTNKPVAHGPHGTTNDFFMNVYSKADGTDDDASWYGRRITLDPRYADNINAPANTWNQWTTQSGGTNELGAYDANNANTGFANPPTWSDITSGSIDWASIPGSGGTQTIDYRNEEVLGLTISAGNPWWPGFDGSIDAIRVDLANGNSVIFDLQAAPVPLPTAAWMGFLMLGSAAGIRVLRQRRAA